MAKPISLLIIDEYQAVRDALVERMNSFAQIEVVAAVADVGESAAYVNGSRPDVILLELKGRRKGGPALITHMREALGKRLAGIIVLTSYADEWEREAALHAGAHRYLLKDINSSSLVAEIEAVAAELRPPADGSTASEASSSSAMTDVMLGA